MSWDIHARRFRRCCLISTTCEIIVGAMWYFVVALVMVVTLIWQMTDLKARVIDLIARNLREPKGLVGHIVRDRKFRSLKSWRYHRHLYARANETTQVTTVINFWWFLLAYIALKLELKLGRPTFSSFNLCPSLPCFASNRWQETVSTLFYWYGIQSMRKKFSIDAKKVFAFEMTAPLETM